MEFQKLPAIITNSVRHVYGKKKINFFIYYQMMCYTKTDSFKIKLIYQLHSRPFLRFAKQISLVHMYYKPKRSQGYNAIKNNELKIDDESFQMFLLFFFKGSSTSCWKICGKQKRHCQFDSCDFVCVFVLLLFFFSVKVFHYFPMLNWTECNFKVRNIFTLTFRILLSF